MCGSTAVPKERGSSVYFGIKVWILDLRTDKINIIFNERGNLRMPANFSLDLQRFYPDDLEIVSIEENSHEIRLHMLSRSKSFCCPGCGEELHKLHATHHRTVQDLPILGKRVFLDIRVHDFQCLQTATFRGQQGRISRPVKAILSGRL